MDRGYLKSLLARKEDKEVEAGLSERIAPEPWGDQDASGSQGEEDVCDGQRGDEP
jgi:hypothetical protein